MTAGRGVSDARRSRASPTNRSQLDSDCVAGERSVDDRTRILRREERDELIDVATQKDAASQCEARRRRGLVLFDGAWMLPEEVEAVARTKAPVTASADRALASRPNGSVRCLPKASDWNRR